MIVTDPGDEDKRHFVLDRYCDAKAPYGPCRKLQLQISPARSTFSEPL